VKISDLKTFEDREVTLHLHDGEILKARVCFVDTEYEDVIVDVIETNRPEMYKNPAASYTIPASEILEAK
jgi:hypothetical protein